MARPTPPTKVVEITEEEIKYTTQSRTNSADKVSHSTLSSIYALFLTAAIIMFVQKRTKENTVIVFMLFTAQFILLMTPSINALPITETTAEPEQNVTPLKVKASYCRLDDVFYKYDLEFMNVNLLADGNVVIMIKLEFPETQSSYEQINVTCDGRVQSFRNLGSEIFFEYVCTSSQYLNIRVFSTEIVKTVRVFTHDAAGKAEFPVYIPPPGIRDCYEYDSFSVQHPAMSNDMCVHDDEYNQYSAIFNLTGMVSSTIYENITLKIVFSNTMALRYDVRPLCDGKMKFAKTEQQYSAIVVDYNCKFREFFNITLHTRDLVKSISIFFDDEIGKAEVTQQMKKCGNAFEASTTPTPNDEKYGPPEQRIETLAYKCEGLTAFRYDFNFNLRDKVKQLNNKNPVTVGFTMYNKYGQKPIVLSSMSLGAMLCDGRLRPVWSPNLFAQLEFFIPKMDYKCILDRDFDLVIYARDAIQNATVYFNEQYKSVIEFQTSKIEELCVPESGFDPISGEALVSINNLKKSSSCAGGPGGYFTYTVTADISFMRKSRNLDAEFGPNLYVMVKFPSHVSYFRPAMMCDGAYRQMIPRKAFHAKHEYISSGYQKCVMNETFTALVHTQIPIMEAAIGLHKHRAVATFSNNRANIPACQADTNAKLNAKQVSVCQHGLTYRYRFALYPVKTEGVDLMVKMNVKSPQVEYEYVATDGFCDNKTRYLVHQRNGDEVGFSYNEPDMMYTCGGKHRKNAVIVVVKSELIVDSFSFAVNDRYLDNMIVSWDNSCPNKTAKTTTITTPKTTTLKPKVRTTIKDNAEIISFEYCLYNAPIWNITMKFNNLDGGVDNKNKISLFIQAQRRWANETDKSLTIVNQKFSVSNRKMRYLANETPQLIEGPITHYMENDQTTLVVQFSILESTFFMVKQNDRQFLIKPRYSPNPNLPCNEAENVLNVINKKVNTCIKELDTTAFNVMFSIEQPLVTKVDKFQAVITLETAVGVSHTGILDVTCKDVNKTFTWTNGQQTIKYACVYVVLGKPYVGDKDRFVVDFTSIADIYSMNVQLIFSRPRRLYRYNKAFTPVTNDTYRDKDGMTPWVKLTGFKTNNDDDVIIKPAYLDKSNVGYLIPADTKRMLFECEYRPNGETEKCKLTAQVYYDLKVYFEGGHPDNEYNTNNTFLMLDLLPSPYVKVIVFIQTHCGSTYYSYFSPITTNTFGFKARDKADFDWTIGKLWPIM